MRFEKTLGSDDEVRFIRSEKSKKINPQELRGLYIYHC